jgi:hypothetical protein
MKDVRRDLPAGTVTLLFTDVEGSTELLHELGADDYAGALAEHRRILREAFEHHGADSPHPREDGVGLRREPVAVPQLPVWGW